MTPPDRFELSVAERDSPLWRRLCADIDRRIESLRTQNDSPSKDERDTAFLRGQIAALKALRALDNPAPRTE